MTISTHLAILNSMLSFVPKYWLNWQILVAILNEFRRQRWDHCGVHTYPPLNISENDHENLQTISKNPSWLIGNRWYNSFISWGKFQHVDAGLRHEISRKWRWILKKLYTSSNSTTFWTRWTKYETYNPMDVGRDRF